MIGELREGAYYVWNRDQLRVALGEEDAAWAAEVFSVTPAGTFEHGASTLQLRSDHDHSVHSSETTPNHT